MTEPEHDPRVSARYRELGREEPGAGVDAAILAASRRAVEARPAPLVAPTGQRRWYVPLAAAAVIVLSATVVFRIWYEAPEMDGDVPAPAATEERARDEKPPAGRSDSPRGEAPSRVQPRRSAPSAREQALPQPSSEPPAASGVPEVKREAQAPAAAAPETAARPAPFAAAKPAPAPMLEQRALGRLKTADEAALEDSPERWLERITELRRKGKDEEADRQLAEFRKRYPDTKIPDAALKRQ